jgi:hypothetical protein
VRGSEKEEEEVEKESKGREVWGRESRRGMVKVRRGRGG